MPSKPEILERAKKHWKLATDAERDQRTREIEDLRFQVAEYQWDAKARAQREGLAAEGGAPAVPPRPILSVPKLDQPIRLVLNQERAAHLGVNIHPVSEDADQDQAKVRQGLYRAIERDSRAHIARSWAFDRAVKCGTGYYLITTEYDDASGQPFDQKILIKRIFRQDSVFWDPSATEPDNSDAEYAFIETWMALDDFKREYPRAKAEFSDETFVALEKSEPDWVNVDGDKKGVRVVQYFYKQHTPREIKAGNLKRTVDDVVVVSCKLNALEVLEEQELNGSRIPIVTVIGRELQPFEKERRREGMIRPARDSQKGFNYAVSQAVELAALEPKAPFIGGEGQFEGHEDAWQQANVRNFPYLEYKPTTIGDQLVPPPQRMQMDMSRLGPSLMLMDKFENAIQATTQTYDPSLGNLSAKERSGKAILALQGQADAGSSDFLQNLSIAIEYEALVILEWMSSVYDRFGRLAQILDGEDNEETVALNAPYVMDQRTGRPRVLPQTSMAGMDGYTAGQMPRGTKHWDLKKGTYGISVKIGKSYQTRQEQGQEEIGQLLAADPALMMAIGDIYMRFRDMPGAEEIADRLKKLIEKLHPGLTSKDDGTLTPEQLKAQLQAQQEQQKQLEQMLQQATQALETEMAKQQATLQKAEIDARVKAEVAKIQADAGMAKETLDSATAVELQRMKNEIELLKLQMAKQQQDDQQAHERGMAGAQAGMAAEESERGREFEGEQNREGREFEAGESERDRQTAAEQADADRKAAEKQAKAKGAKD